MKSKVWLGALAAGMALASAGMLAVPRPKPVVVAGAGQDAYADWQARPQEAFGEGAAVFEQVKATLLAKYVDAGLTEDQLYRAAVQGMVGNIDPTMAPWNKLLSPTEYAELMQDVSGKVTGVGVEVAFNPDSGLIDVTAVIGGTSAQVAGVVAGDQILKIDGRSFKGKQLRDVVYAMRGTAGTTAVLTILRDARVEDLKLTRQALQWDSVHADVTASGDGVVLIHYFTKNTPELLRKALEDLRARQVTGLVVDLRGNAGGVFDEAIASIRLLVPKGQLIVKGVQREGVEESFVGTAAPVLPDARLAVLINGGTMSGAEIMAGALKFGAGATLVGTHTFGKWCSQHIDELPNKFAIKYTVMKFLAPDGLDYAGKGLPPDIEVEMNDDKTLRLQRLPVASVERLAGDVQLRTALNVLKLRDD